MSKAGFIYALINPSMEGLVKIGKTTKDPTGRADELSRATGVPTRFVLAFQAYFDDCSQAEDFVHSVLERKGLRTSTNREFFTAPLSDVIQAILEAQKVLVQKTKSIASPTKSFGANVHPSCDDGEDAPWREPLKLAEEYDLGLGDTIQDLSEALKQYKIAANLGSAYAFLRLGEMFKDGEGCQPNPEKAMDYFKKGVQRGEMRCWAEMAIEYHEQRHLENAGKCWANFFKKWHRSSQSSTSGYGKGNDWYATVYIGKMIETSTPISYIPQLSSIKDEMLSFLEKLIEASGESYVAEISKTSMTTIKNLIPSQLKIVERGLRSSANSNKPKPTATCAKCGNLLASDLARQCLACGHDWHHTPS